MTEPELESHEIIANTLHNHGIVHEVVVSERSAAIHIPVTSQLKNLFRFLNARMTGRITDTPERLMHSWVTKELTTQKRPTKFSLVKFPATGKVNKITLTFQKN